MTIFPDFRRRNGVIKYALLLILLITGLLALNEFRRGNLSETFSNSMSYQQTYHEPPPSMLTELGKIKSIRASCGTLCDTSRPGTPGPYFNHVTAPINCKAIYRNPYIDEGHTFKVPPKEIPPELWNDFTMGNRLTVSAWYFNQIYLGSKARSPVWSKEGIDQMVRQAARGALGGNYGASETNALRDGMDHAPGIKNGRVLVIGSENPWLEATVLEKGAKEVVTLEYGRIESRHPKVKTMVPSEFSESFMNGSLGLFDAVVTFSSVEHSGLGRYGDRLNPWGDIIAIARAWCVTKVGGSLTIGVLYDNEKDYIQYNAHRCYGKIRFPYLCTNWKQHYRGSGIQRVHVFTKVDPKF
ncbi:uncharacterized protein LOC125682335 [Ostrea edulis]|uniref:uncharacterized protein LOC125682335 n=1 Tax=Ostrea edulis TaxID=37623 RepID=UPI0020949E09|nr:uncharacterized protein LOC125682335 [Ostrea edulis]XP_048778788.1 uncharacterized protein LOC125682335 [Ostrea edulis]XP_048778789.1 uncharacterized protein LOC125682335 [Ostrea edulis]